jgi:hypothetical protein
MTSPDDAAVVHDDGPNGDAALLQALLGLFDSRVQEWVTLTHGG